MLRLVFLKKKRMESDLYLRKKENPIRKANIFSKVTFFYMFKVLRQTYRNGMLEGDTFEPLPEHKAGNLGNRLENIWNEKVKKHKRFALHKALFKMFGCRFMILGMCKLLEELILVLVMPLSIGKIVTYFERDQTSVTESQLYIFSFFVIFSLYFNAIISHTSTFHLLQTTMKIRIACSSLMYRKLLKLSRSAVEKTTIGHIITLLSSDIAKFEQGFFLCHFVWIAPIEICVATFLLYREIGLSALCGIIVLIVFLPIQSLVGNMTSITHLNRAIRTDERVRLMNELLSGIQAIKMYCWENSFAKFINNARAKEMGAVKTHAYYVGLLYSFEFFITRLSVFISLVVFVLCGHKLAPEKIFVVTAIYNVIKPAVTIVFAMSIESLLGVNVAVKRIETFLRKEDFIVDPKYYTPNILRNIDPRDVEAHRIIQPSPPGVIIRNVSAKWLDDSDEIILKNLKVEIYSGQLVAIIGPVGCGKSSFLQVLLREMIVIRGEVNIQGRISYASQEPWFFAGSIRQNILFGELYDHERYESVTHACALFDDFRLFPHGDATLVGERGKVLSGGQKSRINLARCVYRKADIYLLDDPLSAVDAKVGKHLYQKCIEKFLRNKICILVTHQLQYLKTADKIIILKEGTIEAIGNYVQLQATGLNFATMLESIEAEIEEKESKNIAENEDSITDDNVRSVKETMEEGVVSIRTYWRYIRAGGNIFLIAILILLIILSHSSAFGGDYFVSYWVNLEQVKVVQPRLAYPETIQRTKVMSIYAALIGSTIITAVCFCMYFAGFFTKASRTLHNTIFKRLIKATMSFFNTNSTGIIMNRFSNDLVVIDEVIPVVLLEVILIGCFVFGIFLLSFIVEPWLALPIIILFVGIYAFRRFYIVTSRSVKRLESVARSPIISHMCTSLEGLATIRSFTMENELIEEFDRLQDNHSSCWFLFLASGRCFGFWLDIFCFTFVAIAIYFMLLLSSDMNGGNIGLVITQYIGLIGSLQWGMRQWSELENQMISVERLLEYSKIDIEPQRKSKDDLPNNWPSEGRVEFKNLSLRYEPTEDYILNDMSFVIEPGEKIGIVGRTGAGKSSTISALFQLYDLEGRISIDDVDITQIPLEVSRRKISIIPQEPFLFSDTMRRNLDPYEEFNDEFLWKALELVELKEIVADDPKGLDLLITEGGHNFSAGERQMVCLARALIRKNRIIIMDEATANVDPYTDAFIQKTIRTSFAECTVLTVAHRLHTVMDSDRILVIKAGRVEEFDHPHLLLENPEGYFHSMVKATGINAFENLKRIAHENYEKKFGTRYIRVEPKKED